MTHTTTDDIIADIRVAVQPPAGVELGALVTPLLDAYAAADRRLTMARAAQFLATTPGNAAMENAFEDWLLARDRGDAGPRKDEEIEARVEPQLKVRVLVARLLHALGPWSPADRVP